LELKRKKIISWALYDWANSGFATVIMACFFPVFFRDYWSKGVDPSLTTFHLGTTNSLASLTIAVIAPFLGAIADRGGLKKKFLFFFAVIGIITTAFLSAVAPGNWKLAAFLYSITIIGFYGGNIFYDSLIVNVSPREKLDLVSAVGYSLGYLGGGLLFALTVLMVRFPEIFNLSDSEAAIRLSFIFVAFWWGIFSLPLFLFVKEPKTKNQFGSWNLVQSGWRQFYHTFQEVKKLQVIFLFLLSYWFYIDGVDTVILMAVDYGMSIGLSSQSLILALLITQFVGFPAALIFGKIGEKLGAKTGIFISIGVYLSVTIWGALIQGEQEFYILAVIVGLVQGGIQSLSRSFYAKIIPQSKSAEFFGFYNMLGKFAAIIGPLLIGGVSWLSKNPRYSILSIGLLFIAGGVILYLVNEKEGEKIAKELE